MDHARTITSFKKFITCGGEPHNLAEAIYKVIEHDPEFGKKLLGHIFWAIDGDLSFDADIFEAGLALKDHVSARQHLQAVTEKLAGSLTRLKGRADSSQSNNNARGEHENGS